LVRTFAAPPGTFYANVAAPGMATTSA